MVNITQFEARTLTWWHSRKAKIDMDPPYQRRSHLWSDQDKAYLIDSIINDYDIPKLYIADFNFGPSSLNIKSLPYAIIDGKQRLEAVFDFFEGKICLNNDISFEENPELNIAGLSYQDLKLNYSEIASKFDNYNLTVMRVVTDDESKINELFVRLNKNKPLNGAEIRNAMQGEIPLFIREIAKNKFFKKCISFSVKRSDDLNLAAKLLLIEFRGGLVDTKKYNLDRFVEEGVKTQSDDLRRAKDRVITTLEILNKVFLEKDKLLSNAGIIPVYYWFIRFLVKQEKAITDCRVFLVSFGNSLSSYRALLKVDGSIPDSDYLNFINFNRSTNDQGSHEGRFKILFKKYSEKNLTTASSL